MLPPVLDYKSAAIGKELQSSGLSLANPRCQPNFANLLDKIN